MTSKSAADASNPARELQRIYGMPGHLIRRAQQIAVAAFMDSTKDYGLTPVQYGTLTVADIYPGIDQRRLAKMVAFDPSTTGDVIQRLEQRGLLRREEGTDRRTKVVFITDSGRAILEAMQQPVLDAQARMLSALSEGEQSILMFLLGKLVNVGDGQKRAPKTVGPALRGAPSQAPAEVESPARPKRTRRA